ncbi:hypothetical protein GCM10023329_13790 [Streptomyces sanyensis]|uniref:Uncharacterized protein n=1 Tax=Streptomyces sanyensis TaxID=568869 RepID=A0ABP8ZY69_9ACTN
MVRPLLVPHIRRYLAWPPVRAPLGTVHMDVHRAKGAGRGQAAAAAALLRVETIWSTSP